MKQAPDRTKPISMHIRLASDNALELMRAACRKAIDAFDPNNPQKMTMQDWRERLDELETELSRRGIDFNQADMPY